MSICKNSYNSAHKKFEEIMGKIFVDLKFDNPYLSKVETDSIFEDVHQRE